MSGSSLHVFALTADIILIFEYHEESIIVLDFLQIAYCEQELIAHQA